jgi:C-terminal processing protease CtpA/Prc
MANKETAEAWDKFQADVKSMAGELRRHYESSDDRQKTAEINQSLRQLGDAAEKFFSSIDTATRDPEVRSSTKRAARSFGTALRETFHEVSEELEKALREPAARS